MSGRGYDPSSVTLRDLASGRAKSSRRACIDCGVSLSPNASGSYTSAKRCGPCSADQRAKSVAARDAQRKAKKDAGS